MDTLATAPSDLGLCHVLVNSRGRHALWPAPRELPAGWTIALEARTRAECLDHVRRSWTVGGEPVVRRAARTMKFGLMFFGGGEHDAAAEKYRLIIECARFADERDFSAIWLPERHFSKMGCLYPNPAVLMAALARETSRLRLRAGSVVLPLHNPVRVAEEWAVVDNLSGGRVDLSLASGWNAEDFALSAAPYAERHRVFSEGIDVVRRLWKGETVEVRGADGALHQVRTYPTPVQPELPLWLTAAENPATFRQAGAIGANLLTHLFDLGVEQLAERIALYRDARRRAGLDPAGGRVAVALHTFIAEDTETVRRHSRAPYCDYLRANVRMLEKLAASRGLAIDVAQLSAAQLDEAVEFLYEKFLDGRSLLGTAETCASLVAQLAEKGVDEIACLLDFGPSPEAIAGGLRQLSLLADRFR